MKTVVFPYRTASKSATLLAETLNAPMVGRDINMLSTSKLKPAVINWGHGGDDPSWMSNLKVLNKPSKVLNAVNKIKTMQLLKAANVRSVPWTTSFAQALEWAMVGRVCCRTKVESKDGDGLVIANNVHQLVDAKLYTKFIRARNEYRVNVVGDQTVAVQLKVRVPGKTSYNDDVKTTSGGYGFSLVSEANIPIGIRPLAKAAIKALGLDFGGVDIVVGMDGTPYVLEVNSAPELTPTTVQGYALLLSRTIS